MALWLRCLNLDQKVHGSMIFDPSSNSMYSCHSCDSNNSYTQAHEVYFHCLPSHHLDETLNRGPKSIALVLLAPYTKYFPDLVKKNNVYEWIGYLYTA